MSDDPTGNEGGGDAPSGRWLGAVRSWIGGTEGVGDAAEEGGATTAVNEESSTPTLSADEIRRRRLERMEGSKSQQV